MQLTGVTINIMTLGGLAVAVGRVVDDAIVVLENIYRHRSLGEDRLTASINGPREVAGAITASTLTTVAVFLPLGFVGGLVSQFFLPFALTVTFALLASLICALTVVPVLAYFLIRKVTVKVDASGEPVRSFWVRGYTPTIRWVLRSRWTSLAVLGIAAILFVASTALAPLLPTQFINAGAEKTLLVTVSPPTGATSDAVLDRAIQAETILLADPAVKLVQTSIPGEGDSSSQAFQSALLGRATNSATMTVQLHDEADVDATTVRLTEALAPVHADGFDAQVDAGGGFTSNGLRIIVSSPDEADVATATEAIVTGLADQPDLANLQSDLVKATPEVQVTVDPNKAIAVGMSAAQVSAQVRTSLVAQNATTVQTTDGQNVAVVVQVDPAAVSSVADLQKLPVGTVAKVPLGSIATIEQVDVQGSITRIDQQPSSSITAKITSDDTGAVSMAVQSELDSLAASGAIPSGTTAELAGVSQQQSEAFGGLFASMGVAVLLVYVMMVLTFNSLITPFIILFTLPLATIGAFPALYLTGRPIGVSALIGFLMLIGIVVTNAIVLLDLVERLRSEGHSTRDALIEGGRTQGPADPHDGDRHDPRPDPACRGVQPGFDHRRRAGHGRHRRPVQLDVPDPARHPRRLRAGRRLQGPRRAAVRGRAGRRGGARQRLRPIGGAPRVSPAPCGGGGRSARSASAPPPCGGNHGPRQAVGREGVPIGRQDAPRVPGLHGVEERRRLRLVRIGFRADLVDARAVVESRMPVALPAFRSLLEGREQAVRDELDRDDGR